MSAICGTHSFHYIHSGFDITTNASFYFASDTTVVIVYFASTAIKLKDDIFEYDSTSVSGVLYFHYVSTSTTRNTDSRYIHFNHVTAV